MLITVLNKQSFLDLAILGTGDITNAFLIAQENQKTPDDEIEAGAKISIPKDVVFDTDILKYYQVEELQPATALTQGDIDLITGCEGIGCWAIGIDFQVS